MQVTLDPGQSHVTQIYPTQFWQDAGVTVRAGETYRVSAEGTWSFGLICGVADANGSGNTPLCEGDPGSVPGAGSAALVGKIGETGAPFVVGKVKTLTAPASGVLYMGTNAWDWLPGDNTGFMEVTVRKEAASAAQIVTQPPAPAAKVQPLTPLDEPKAIPASGPRVALVIGNSNYPAAPLANPVNDAALMARTLKTVGFEVIHVADVDQKDMKRALNTFGDRLDALGGDAVGLFYYAGHGIQVNGRNYLIPVDADIQNEKDVDVEGVAMDSVLTAMEYAQNRLNFVVLDACRNNPYKRSFRGSTRGLARMDAPSGTLIAYATGPGDVAQDGAGTNSPYTEALARAIIKSGVTVERMFRMVRNSVMAATANAQVPWEASSLTGGDFYFRP
ncbi:MAG: caspase family protein [Alphaproteobacteria bacterium]|nr:caspase family protein [Alphaproteobacteria bacterium]